MSHEDWARFEALVRVEAAGEPTLARAHGIVLSKLLESATAPPVQEPTPLDWMDWERLKTLRLLRSAV